MSTWEQAALPKPHLLWLLLPLYPHLYLLLPLEGPTEQLFIAQVMAPLLLHVPLLHPRLPRLLPRRDPTGKLCPGVGRVHLSPTTPRETIATFAKKCQPDLLLLLLWQYLRPEDRVLMKVLLHGSNFQGHMRMWSMMLYHPTLASTENQCI